MVGSLLIAIWMFLQASGIFLYLVWQPQTCDDVVTNVVLRTEIEEEEKKENKQTEHKWEMRFKIKFQYL